MSKAERASLDKNRDRDLHVSGGRLTRPLAMSSGRNGASSVEVLFSIAATATTSSLIVKAASSGNQISCGPR